MKPSTHPESTTHRTCPGAPLHRRKSLLHPSELPGHERSTGFDSLRLPQVGSDDRSTHADPGCYRARYRNSFPTFFQSSPSRSATVIIPT
jgi:hypothetical protein